MDVDTNQHAAATKMSLVWLGAVFGSLSTWPLAQWVLLATLVYTVLQTAKLARDWLLSRRDRAEAKAKELLATAREEAKIVLEDARKEAQ